MKTKRYKTLKGLMKALDNFQFSVLDMNRGQAYFRDEEHTCKFALPEQVMQEFYAGCAAKIYRHPQQWQINALRKVEDGIFRRLWFDGERYVYCTGQDWPSERRCMQSIIRNI